MPIKRTRAKLENKRTKKKLSPNWKRGQEVAKKIAKARKRFPDFSSI